MPFDQVVADPLGLVQVGIAVDHPRRDPRAANGHQLLIVPQRRLRQEPIGKIQDLLGGTIIVLQLQHGRAGNPFGEGVNVAKIRTPKRINTLGIVADAKQLSRIPDAVEYKPLQRVGVLHFVDQDVVEQSPHPIPRRRIGVQSPRDHVQDIVVVEVTTGRLAFLISLENLDDSLSRLLVVLGVVFQVIRNRLVRVAGEGIKIDQFRRLGELLVLLGELRPAHLHQLDRVVAVDHGVVVESEVPRPTTDRLQTEPVKRAGLHAFGGGPREMNQPMLHLASRASGEGQQQDAVGRHGPTDQVGDAGPTTVVVFPVPAPASTSACPPSCSTAARCCGFNSIPIPIERIPSHKIDAPYPPPVDLPPPHNVQSRPRVLFLAVC